MRRGRSGVRSAGTKSSEPYELVVAPGLKHGDRQSSCDRFWGHSPPPTGCSAVVESENCAGPSNDITPIPENINH